MKIDFCKIFGVKPDQEFKIYGFPGDYRIRENVLECLLPIEKNWNKSNIGLNDISGIKIIFYSATEDEKTILRSLDEKYRNGYIKRDNQMGLIVGYYVGNAGFISHLPYNNLFPYIQCDSGEVPIKDIIGEGKERNVLFSDNN